MRDSQTGFLGFVLVVVTLSLAGCQRMPAGDWQIEIGRAQTVDDQGERKTRIEAVEAARHNAHLKILRQVKTIPVDNYLVADYMQQNPLIGVRVRSLILIARLFETRYLEDGSVEVEMGVNLDEVRRIVRETKLQQ